jgi:hypothetical protein
MNQHIDYYSLNYSRLVLGTKMSNTFGRPTVYRKFGQEE